MYKKFIFTLLMSFTIPYYANAQQMRGIDKGNLNEWKTNIDLGSFEITTFLDSSYKKGFVVFESPKNADRRILGNFKSTIGRFLGKIPHHGILLTIKAHQNGNSLKGTLSTPILGKLNFQGSINENVLSGTIFKDKDSIGSLKGHRTSETKLDFQAIYLKMAKVTHNHIYSTSVLKTKEWQTFNEKMMKLSKVAVDDIEFFLGFSIYAKKLPFSHYHLILSKNQSNIKSSNSPTSASPVDFKELDSANIAYVKIKNFSTSEQAINATFSKIMKRDYHYLIIDLRNNPGGGIDAAFALSKYIVKDSLLIGYFVTNKLSYHGAFSQAIFNRLPVSHAKTTDELIQKLKTSSGVKLYTPLPRQKVFNGKIYILTNRNTASTCEPIVYILKNKKIATIVGQNTAGHMLSGAFFEIQGKYRLFLPIADFYTYDGQRIEGKGVAPNVATKPDEALDKVLDLIRLENIMTK